MKIKPLLCGLALASAFVATNAYAETLWEGMEMRVGLTAPAIIDHVKTKQGEETTKYERLWSHDDIWAGFSGTLSFGYRWGIFGLYIDQDMGGVWWTGDVKKGEEEPDPAFIGGTYLTFRGLLGLRHDVEMDLGLGIGTMYSSGDRKKTAVFIMNEKEENTAAFAMKFCFGLTYYLLPNTIGVGINLDYNLALNFYSFNKEYEGETSVYHLVHHVNPGIHVIAQF